MVILPTKSIGTVNDVQLKQSLKIKNQLNKYTSYDYQKANQRRTGRRFNY